MRTATVQFEQPNQKNGVGLLPVVGVGAIIFLIVGLACAVVLVTQQGTAPSEPDVISVYNPTSTPTPTPAPVVEPVITPSPEPTNVSYSVVNDTSYQALQEYANNAINNTSYQPAYRPSPVPYTDNTACTVAQQLGWTYGCGLSPEQYIEW